MTWTSRFIVLFSGLACCLAGCSRNSSDYYRFVSYDARMDVVGRAEVSEADAPRRICYRIARDEEGRVDTVEFRRLGRPAVDGFFGAAKVIFQYKDGFQRRVFLDSTGRLAANIDSVFTARLRLNENGVPIDMFNYGSDGAGTEDRFGVTQYVYSLDDEGRISRVVRINKEGERMVDRLGLYETQFAYDEFGNATERSNYSRDGQRLTARDNVAIVRWVYDESGNRIEENYLGADEQPIERKDLGVAAIRWKYDDRGDTVEVRYLDIVGHLSDRTDLGISMVQYKFDEAGNVVEQRYFGPVEQLKDRKDLGVAIIATRYDSLGLRTEERYFGTDERPKEAKPKGVAVMRWEYDAKGTLLAESGQDLTGKDVDLKKKASPPRKPRKKVQEQDDFW